MKVSEAKEKVCPFMSGQVGDYDKAFATVSCICGDCMAWQFTKTTYTKKYVANRVEDKHLIDADGLFVEEVSINGEFYYLPEDQSDSGYEATYYCMEDSELEDKEGYCARIGQ